MALVDLPASLIQLSAMMAFIAMRTRFAGGGKPCFVYRNPRRATGDVAVRSGRVAGREREFGELEIPETIRLIVDVLKCARRPPPDEQLSVHLFRLCAFLYGDACSITALSSAPARMAIPDM